MTRAEREPATYRIGDGHWVNPVRGEVHSISSYSQKEGFKIWTGVGKKELLKNVSHAS